MMEHSSILIISVAVLQNPEVPRVEQTLIIPLSSGPAHFLFYELLIIRTFSNLTVFTSAHMSL